MNQHLPPENIRSFGQFKTEAPALAVPAFTEQFFILRGRHEAYISGDLVDRATVIVDVAEDVENLRQIIAIDLANGTSRDATDDVCGVVIERWAEDGKLLTTKQRDFVAMCKGEAFANCFKLERE
jgi:hypothetical protein